MKLPHLILSVLIMCSCVYAKKKPKPPDPNLWKNELRDQELNKATCPYIALIFTRDLDIDVGNVGMNGLELYNRLKKDFKMAPFRDDNTVQPFLKMQGVNYQHIFDLSTHEVVRYPMPEAHRIAHPEAVRMTKNLISHVVETCNGRTNIVLAGFQRGVDVLRNITHSLTEAERNEVVALIAISDSKFLSRVPVGKRFAFDQAKILEQCRKDDDWCHHLNWEVDNLDEIHNEGPRDPTWHGEAYKHHWSKAARDFIFARITDVRGDDDDWVSGR